MTPNIQHWRFCNVYKNDKRPYPDDWQNCPLTLDQLDGNNYGLLSGRHSGVLAIDFDGLWAFDWWEKTLSHIKLPETIMWSSGVPNRVQMAFNVDEIYWPHIKTRKFTNGLKKPDLEGIEFRFDGCQSVLPPSVHPDTGKPYEWIGNVVDAADCPLELIEYLIELNIQKQVVNNAPAKNITLDSSELEELDKVLQEYKRIYPNLGYDQWRNTTWACITHVGHAAGIAVMQTFYPEQQAGEYDKLAKTYKAGNTWSIGSLIKMVQEKEPSFALVPKYANPVLIRQLLQRLKGEK